jgi:hypothetical protein
LVISPIYTPASCCVGPNTFARSFADEGQFELKEQSIDHVAQLLLQVKKAYGVSCDKFACFTRSSNLDFPSHDLELLI